MDVWFDSGTSYTVLKRYGLPEIADVVTCAYDRVVKNNIINRTKQYFFINGLRINVLNCHIIHCKYSS